MEKITKEQNKREWKPLCEYIKENILRYKKEQLFPKTLALRLKGLAQGKDYPNKSFEQIYSYDFLLKVFKYLKYCIIEVIDKTEINDEKHLCNLIMKIVWNHFNDIVNDYNKSKIKEKEMEEKRVDEIITINENEYVKKEHKVKDNW